VWGMGGKWRGGEKGEGEEELGVGGGETRGGPFLSYWALGG